MANRPITRQAFEHFFRCLVEDAVRPSFSLERDAEDARRLRAKIMAFAILGEWGTEAINLTYDHLDWEVAHG